MTSSAHNIALFIDGTWNEASVKEPTNTYKLFRASRVEETGTTPQITYYLPGVGRDVRQPLAVGAAAGWYGTRTLLPIRPEVPPGLGLAHCVLGRLFGAGTAARIKEAYAFLSYHFVRDRGDRIYIFGFSRGAFAARSLAGFVFRVGTLLARDLDLVEAAYAVYESGVEPQDTLLAGFLQQAVRKAMLQSLDDPAAMPIHFVGLWDTVSALGLPRRAARFTAERTRHHQTTPPLNVLSARHALALHELRADFAPEIWISGGSRNLEQKWFPGVHADVGGGYAVERAGLSRVALQWIADEANHHRLQFRAEVLREVLAPAGTELNNSLSREFRGFAAVPRRALLRLVGDALAALSPAADGLDLHDSVGRYVLARDVDIEPGWPAKVRAALDTIDEKILQAFVLGRLQAAHRTDPPKKPGPAAAPSASGAVAHGATVSSPLPPWWQMITLSELGQCRSRVASFRARVVEPFVSTGSEISSAAAQQQGEADAGALLLLHLLSQEATLEAVLELASVGAKALAATIERPGDPRDDGVAVADAYQLAMLHPVLVHCAGLLAVQGGSGFGEGIAEAAEQIRKVLVEYSVLPMRYGVRGANNVAVGRRLTPRPLG